LIGQSREYLSKLYIAQKGVAVNKLCLGGRASRRTFIGDFRWRRLLFRLNLCAESLKPLLAKIVPELAVVHAQAILAELISRTTRTV